MPAGQQRRREVKQFAAGEECLPDLQEGRDEQLLQPLPPLRQLLEVRQRFLGVLQLWVEDNERGEGVPKLMMKNLCLAISRYDSIISNEAATCKYRCCPWGRKVL